MARLLLLTSPSVVGNRQLQNQEFSAHLMRTPGDIHRPAAYGDWDHDLLSEHFNLDPHHNVAQDADFLFSLPGVLPLEEVVSQAPMTPSSISPLISQEKSELVRDAFKMATGRWMPGERNFHEDEMKNISATQGATIMTESDEPCDINLMPDGFPLVVRDRLLAMCVSASDSRDNLRVSSAFPSCDSLALLFKSFLSWHIHRDDTWIHIPTFDINKAKVELIAAILAGGAMRSPSRAVQKFGLALHELLAVQLLKIVRRSTQACFIC